jgi:hypothetical protein
MQKGCKFDKMDYSKIKSFSISGKQLPELRDNLQNGRKIFVN